MKMSYAYFVNVHILPDFHNGQGVQLNTGIFFHGIKLKHRVKGCLGQVLAGDA